VLCCVRPTAFLGLPDREGILSLTAEFESASPGFEFFVDWPNDGDDFMRWNQSDRYVGCVD
jgi:hypothetical protein